MAVCSLEILILDEDCVFRKLNAGFVYSVFAYGGQAVKKVMMDEEPNDWDEETEWSDEEKHDDEAE